MDKNKIINELKEEIKNKAWAYDLKSLERKIQEAISIANMK